MELELIAGVGAVPVIIALIQVLKKTFGLNKKFAPIAAIILGQAFAFAAAYYGGTVEYEAAIMGLVSGLSAVGLYSGVKNTKEG